MRQLPGRRIRCAGSSAAAALVVVALCGGCDSLQQWVHNGFKVGPNFHEPPAPVADAWIDAADPHVNSTATHGGTWWSVFMDPTLCSLVETAYRQNLDLQTAATRVLEAQGQRNVAIGNLLPQTQNATGDYLHAQISKNLNFFGNPMAALPTNIDVWAVGFNASWELDFWGRLRRAVESSNADLAASAEGYHDALVTLIGDVANNYVQVRTFQQRLAFARRNVVIQQGTLRIAEARLKAGKATALDVKQARSSLAQTEASIPPLALGLRQVNNRLCVLLGMPPHDLVAELHEGPIPAAPAEVAVGVPADLLHRRPDVRKALREAASQSAQIGIAESDFYPRIGVSGFIGYTANDIRRLFAEDSFTGVILPNVQWKILNYGRIANNVRTQEARLTERILHYQQTVLKAGQEVEDGLAGFLQYQRQARDLETSVAEAEDAMELVQAQYEQGLVDFNRVFTAQAQLVALQDQLAAARGNIALSLIGVYRALGGGWETLAQGPALQMCVPQMCVPEATPETVDH
jgi:NodT family efflux transporter outer membrane factor (OMF) lipoprotein